MILIQPEKCVRHQEVPDLVSAVIEDQRVPVLLDPLTGVGVFIEVGSVEVFKGMGVPGKMGRNPIQDDAQSCGMAPIHKVHKVLGCSVSGGRGIVAGNLISPGTVKRVFSQGQELDIIESHLLDIGDKFFCRFPVGQPAVAFLVAAAPGTEVNLINGKRGVQGIAFGS